ncbi:12836_t:CDS:2, partial [Gigaspora rosea]
MSQRSIAQQLRQKQAQEHERNEQQQEPNQYAIAHQQQQTHETEAQEHEQTQRAITQQLRQAHEQETRELEPSLESIQAFEILSQARQNSVSETDLAVHLHFNAATDQRHYNFPTTNEIAIILPGGKLFQEFLVDAWASTEQNRLRYLRNNQATLRAD